jgi:hypothetical protein
MTKIAMLFLLLASAQETQNVSKKQITTPRDQPGATATTHQAVLTWTLPTTCTDGSPCTPVAITVYKIVGTCSAPTTQFTKLVTLGGTIRAYTDSGLAALTTYCYYVTASLATPAAWSATVTYTGGQMVTYTTGAIYVALNNATANLNQPPPTSPAFWQVTSVESSASNTAGGSTGSTGPPAAPTGLVITVQ